MRILHVTECLAGGVLTFLVNLTNQLSTDQHIIIYGVRENTPAHVESLFRDNVQLIRWERSCREIKIKTDILSFLELMKILKNFRDVDIVHLHSSKAGFLGRVACRLLGKTDKVFYTPHGLSFARKDISRRKRAFYLLLEKTANCFCGDIVACSDSEKNLLFKNGIHNVYVVNNGIIIDKKDDLHNLSSDFLIIGCVGRITSAKNPILFNEIARKFRSNHKIHFLWVGDGELRNNINESSNVRVTGWLTPKEVRKYLNQIDIYLSTSSWEGLPFSVLEAMNMGKPLVLSDCIGNVDLVENWKNGFLYHNSDEAVRAINLFTNDLSLVNKMGALSREKVKTEFSVDQMVSKYMELYHK